MGKGFDCATPLSPALAAKFAEQGFTYVARYLAEKGSWKRMSPAEAQTITDAGMYIVSVFERGASRASEGRYAGSVDGTLALQLANEVGQPEGSVIYFAVDFNADPSHFDGIEEYLRAADAQIRGYECAVYGEEEVCRAMLERGVVTKVWQTYAWSRGKKVDDPNLYQHQNDITVNGIGIDLDESNGNAGGWKVGMAIEKPTLVGVLDADLMIGLLQEAHRQGITRITLPDGNVAVVDQNEIHRLANVARAASGQPEE